MIKSRPFAQSHSLISLNLSHQIGSGVRTKLPHHAIHFVSQWFRGVPIADCLRKRQPRGVHGLQQLTVKIPRRGSIDYTAASHGSWIVKKPSTNSNVRDDIAQRGFQTRGERIQVRNEFSAAFSIKYLKLADSDPVVVSMGAVLTNQLKSSRNVQCLNLQINFGYACFGTTNACPLQFRPKEWRDSHDERNHCRRRGCNGAPIKHASLSERSAFDKSLYPTHLMMDSMYVGRHSAMPFQLAEPAHG